MYNILPALLLLHAVSDRVSIFPWPRAFCCGETGSVASHAHAIVAGPGKDQQLCMNQTGKLERSLSALAWGIGQYVAGHSLHPYGSSHHLQRGTSEKQKRNCKVIMMK